MVDYNISAVRRRKVFSGSAGVGPYACTFEILAQTDIQVYKNTTLLTLTTDYTVSIASNGTFSVTLVVAATGSDTVTVAGARDIARTTDFVTAGDLRASALNEQLDGLTIFDQQMAEQAERAIKFPITDSTTLSATLPVAATRASKFLSFDASGNVTATALGSVGTTAFATASDMTAGTAADVMVSPKELTEWAPAAATLAGTDELLVRDASDNLIKRMPALATTSSIGVVELATVAEAQAGTDTSRAITADGLKATVSQIPQNSQSAAYELVLADAGKHIYHPSSDNNARTFTIPANSSVAYEIGTCLTFINDAATASTIAITTDTLVLSPAGTTGSRTLAQYGVATAIKVTSTRWIISGTGLT